MSAKNPVGILLKHTRADEISHTFRYFFISRTSLINNFMYDQMLTVRIVRIRKGSFWFQFDQLMTILFSFVNKGDNVIREY
jgi:hypothetical protein